MNKLSPRRCGTSWVNLFNAWRNAIVASVITALAHVHATGPLVHKARQELDHGLARVHRNTFKLSDAPGDSLGLSPIIRPLRAQQAVERAFDLEGRVECGSLVEDGHVSAGRIGHWLTPLSV
jgi:hypothetical protein